MKALTRQVHSVMKSVEKGQQMDLSCHTCNNKLRQIKHSWAPPFFRLGAVSLTSGCSLVSIYLTTVAPAGRSSGMMESI